jgi:hypothetical protein
VSGAAKRTCFLGFIVEPQHKCWMILHQGELRNEFFPAEG